MGDVVAVVSGKGGVGKSTVTAGIGVCLARAGKRVALVDMDMGLRSLDVLLGLENRIVYDLADVAEGMCRPRQALVRHPKYENMVLLSAAQSRTSEALTPRQVENVLASLKELFDVVLVDGPAGIGRGFRNAVTYADHAMVVATPDPITLRDAERVAGLIERMDVSRALTLNRVLSAHMQGDAPYGVNAFRERLRLPIIGLIPEDGALPLVAAGGIEPVIDRTAAGAAIARIARRTAGEAVPLVPIERERLLVRLKKALKPEY